MMTDLRVFSRSDRYIYIEAVLEQLRKEGYPANEEDKARLSHLIDEHINTHGPWPRYGV
jgi:hypothetical protein